MSLEYNYALYIFVIYMKKPFEKTFAENKKEMQKNASPNTKN